MAGASTDAARDEVDAGARFSSVPSRGLADPRFPRNGSSVRDIQGVTPLSRVFVRRSFTVSSPFQAILYSSACIILLHGSRGIGRSVSLETGTRWNDRGSPGPGEEQQDDVEAPADDYG